MANTPANSIRDACWAYFDGLRALNFTGPVYVGIHSRLGIGPSGINQQIRGGIMSMVDAARDIRLGFDCDTLEGANRQTATGDPLHLSALGCMNYGYGIADVMYP